MKPSGDRIKANMVDHAEKALRLTAEQVLKRAQRDVPKEDGDLMKSGKVEVVRVGDALEAKVSFTAPHAATQEIGGRRVFDAPKVGIGPKSIRRFDDGSGRHVFIKYKNHPGGGKDHFLGDALKAANRQYRANLKKSIKAGL